MRRELRLPSIEFQETFKSRYFIQDMFWDTKIKSNHVSRRSVALHFVSWSEKFVNIVNMLKKRTKECWSALHVVILTIAARNARRKTGKGTNSCAFHQNRWARKKANFISMPRNGEVEFRCILYICYRKNLDLISFAMEKDHQSCFASMYRLTPPFLLSKPMKLTLSTGNTLEEIWKHFLTVSTQKPAT